MDVRLRLLYMKNICTLLLEMGYLDLRFDCRALSRHPPYVATPAAMLVPQTYGQGNSSRDVTPFVNGARHL